MNNLLQWIRYSLMLLSIIGTALLTPISSYPIYTLLTLLYVAIDSFQARITAQWKGFFLWGQIIYISYLSYTYQGFIFLLYYSTLLILLPKRLGYSQLTIIFIQWLLINFFLESYSLIEKILANIMYAVIVAILILMSNITKQKEEIEQLYDSLRKNHYELNETKNSLIEYTKRVENVAQIEERNRISKDIHDDLGHQLIRIKMMTEALIKVLPQDTSKGMEMIYQIRDQLSTSMERLRETVRKIKPKDNLVDAGTLTNLVDQFSKNSNILVDYQVQGQAHTLYPSVEVVLYRNAQEALSNAVRHGNATAIDIQLRFEEAHIEMSITNNGQLPSSMEKGIGLRGMIERTALLGGRVEVCFEDIFSVKTIIPIKKQSS